MYQVTLRGKFLGFAMGFALAVGVLFSAPVRATFGTDAAMVIAFLQTAFITLMQTMLTEQIYKPLVVEQGNGAIVEQVAAGTLGTQQALQAHAGVMVESIAQQTAAAEQAIYNRTFGTLMNMQVNGRNVSVGANAPSACRRTNDARRLTVAGTASERERQRADESIATHSQGYGSYAGMMANMRQRLERFGPSGFSPNHLRRDTIPADDAERVRDAIAIAMTPTPLPPLPRAASNQAAAAEYQTRAAIFTEVSKIPAEILARHAALRVAPGTGENERSYLETIKRWAQEGVESAERPVELAAKTEAGLLREQTLLLSALLWVQTEQLQTQHELAQLMALQSASDLDARGDALRAEYARLVRAD